jgi:site-specific recombinase XerD
MISITASIQDYLRELSGARSAGTVRAYKNGLAHLEALLRKAIIDPDATTPSQLSEDHALSFINRLQQLKLAPATQKLYMAALRGYLEYLEWQKLASIDLGQVVRFSKRRLPNTGQRLPQFPKDEIEKVIEATKTFVDQADNDQNQLVALRDRAFILALADTGMRVHEACGLTRGDVDWREARAVIIGKGDKQAVVRFSKRSLAAIKAYLEARGELDGASGRRLTSLPLFTGHGRSNLQKGGGVTKARLKPLTTRTGRNIVTRRVREVLGAEAVGKITPHSFRHYFVTTVLRSTGGDIHLAQRLARHSSIAITERYAHLADDELDRGYDDIFNS